jgi:hypothetical protein
MRSRDDEVSHKGANSGAFIEYVEGLLSFKGDVVLAEFKGKGLVINRLQESTA